MRFKAVIFDLDGTIIDTEKVWKEATRCLLERKGCLYTPELARTVKERTTGLAVRSTCAVIKELSGLPDAVDDLLRERLQIVHELYDKYLCFVPGFEAFHAQVVQSNLKMGIATSCDDVTMRVVDQALNLKKFFGEHVYGISCVGNQCKPNPAIYTFAAQQLGILPSECFAIEDSAFGIAAAKGAGIYCIGINTNHDRAFLQQADMIVEGYHELDLDGLLQKR